jgi:hypothetical protein
MGTIIGVNLSFTSIYGCNKSDILNKNVNIIMPFIYAKYHDNILKKYSETNV